MEIIIPVIFVVALLYIILKPSDTETKKFGEGLLQDSDAEDWWNLYNGDGL